MNLFGKIVIAFCAASLTVGSFTSCRKTEGETGTSLTDDKVPTEAEFRNPGLKYHPMPIVNTNVSDYLVDMAYEYGYGGLVTNISFGGKDYLYNEEATEMFVDSVRHAVDDLGMRIWIYDECGYPSGTAGGSVTSTNPEYAAQGLVVRTYHATKGSELTFEIPYKHTLLTVTAYRNEDLSSSPVNLNDRVSGGNFAWTPSDGNWLVVARYQKDFYEGTHGTGNWYSKRRILDMLNKDATAAFIESTYERYLSLVGGYFGNGIEAFFTDEPALAGLYIDPPSWSTAVDDLPDDQIPLYATANYSWNFEEEFLKRRGYSLGDKAVYLFSSDTDEAKRVRWDYYKTVDELKAEGYEGQISSWCENNGVSLSGHFFDEEDLYDHAYYNGNLLRSLANQTIPGIDFLSNNMSVAVGWAAVTPKFASSAAHYKNQNTVFCEISNDYDSVKADVYGMINTAGLLYACGINEFGSYFRLTGGNPKLTQEEHALLATTLGRMGYLLKNRIQQSDVALYYPSEGLFVQSVIPENGRKDSINLNARSISDNFTQIAKTLLTNQIGYEIFDSYNLVGCKVENGKLVTPSGMKFSTVILPSTPALEKGVAEKLIELVESGGKVFIQQTDGFLAETQSYQNELDAAVRRLSANGNVFAFSAVSEIVEKTDRLNGSGISFAMSNNGVIASKFVNSSDTDVFVFVNTTGRTANVVAETDVVGKDFRLWNPYDGTVSGISATVGEKTSKIMISIPANRTLFITVKR